ncbi:low-specificity L-threonine aldolase [Saccharospirillum sp. HFRX-1]|uniref:low-specificity L-threonine aldolase n=1 Tax=unclassified Saccharospirillum TaxID=2633430 RepID=UPI00371E84CA
MSSRPVPIDLRSDTVTRPTEAMRQVMAQAEVGDDVYGDDPSVNALEARLADITGKAAAVLLPSGTQSNLVALLAHCQRGEEYIVGQQYHTYKYEAGGAAVLGSIQPQPLTVQADATLDLAEVEAYIKPDDVHFARTRVLALENTHGGQVLPDGYSQQARALVDRYGLSLHLDGARLFNASVATGQSLRELAAPFDSVSLCCSKGLGAPIGSVLVGSAELIQRARRWRKMVGGGLRQAGIFASAIDYALDHHVERLADDHRRAAELAAALDGLPHVQATVAHTNMAFLTLDSAATGDALKAALAESGLLIAGGQRIRLVTHLGIDDAALATLIERIIAHLKTA